MRGRELLRKIGSPGPETAAASVPEKPGAFGSVDELLEAGRQMFLARRRAGEARESLARGQRDDDEQARVTGGLEHAARAWTSYFHRSFTATGDAIHLCARCRAKRLNRLEREILVGTILFHLSLLEVRGRLDCCDMLRMLQVPGTRTVEAMRLM